MRYRLKYSGYVASLCAYVQKCCCSVGASVGCRVPTMLNYKFSRTFLGSIRTGADWNRFQLVSGRFRLGSICSRSRSGSDMFGSGGALGSVGRGRLGALLRWSGIFRARSGVWALEEALVVAEGRGLGGWRPLEGSAMLSCPLLASSRCFLPPSRSPARFSQRIISFSISESVVLV